MNRLENLPTGQRLLFTFGALCAILLVIGGSFHFGLRAIERGNQLEQSSALNRLALIDDATQEVGAIQADVLRHVLTTDIEEMRRLDQSVRDLKSINAGTFADLVAVERERQLCERVLRARKVYWEQTEPVLVLSRVNRNAEATELILAKQAPAYDEFLKVINELADRVEADAKEAAGAMTRLISETRTICDTLVGLTIVIILGTGVAVAGVARQLKEDNWFLQNEAIERKRAEAELKELSQKTERRERLLTTLLSALHDFAYVFDREGRFLFANRPLLELWGIPLEEAVGKDCLDLRYPDELAAKLQRQIEEVFTTGQSVIDETPYTSPAGLEGCYEYIFSPACGADGAVDFVVGSTRDITERKRMEESLREYARLAELEAEVRSALAGGESLAETLRSCSETIVHRLDGAFARIWTLNEREQMLELQASAGLYTHLDGAHGRVPVGKFKIGLIAEERKPHLTNQVVGDPRVGEQEWAKREGMVAFAGYPLLVNDRLVGVVAMFARHTLSESTLTALASVASNIAAGIERKRSEESHVLFRTLIDQSNDVIEVVDAETYRYLDINETACLRHGYTREEMLSMSVGDIDPDLTPALRERIEREVKTVGSMIFESRHRRKDGSIFPVEVNIRLVRLDKPYIVTAVRDITERQRVATELSESRRLLRSALDALSSHIAILDEHGTIVEVNAAWNRFAGENDSIGSRRGVGENYLRICEAASGNGAKEAPSVADGIRAVMAGQRDEFQVEYPCHSPREKRWFIVRGTRFAGDGPVRVVVAHENITARKQAEEALLESKHFAESIAEHSTSHIYVFDLETRSTVYANRDLAASMGYSRAQITELGGNLLPTIIHPEDLSRIVEHNERFMEVPDSRVLEVEYRVKHASGEWRWHWARQVVFKRRPNGAAWQILGTAQDVTERKRAEEELRWKTAFLEAQVNSSPDGIVVVDQRGRKIFQNQRFLEMWNTLPEIADDPYDEQQLRRNAAMVTNPAQFNANVDYLNSHPNEIGRDEFELKDGRVFDRYSAPVIGTDGKYY